ncbi:MAG: cyclase family protein [Lentisphaeria bacterium]|nr:cyclase family protein [Lentisphaeria bacterium]
MTITDLTMDFTGERFAPEIKKEKLFLKSGKTEYTGVVYTLTHDGMSGTYIDFPGHIAETDNGATAENYPVEDLYRVKADVIRFHKQSGDGAVNGEDLEKALPADREKCKILVINALGEKNPKDIEERSVYLSDSAVEWIIRNNYTLVVSDIYESQALHGVFLKLFAAGISTVCMPVNLYKLPEKQIWLTVLFAKMPSVTQLPCRVVAEY